MTEIIVAITTGIFTLIVSIVNLQTNRKNVKKEDLIREIEKVQLDNCKNYLVQSIAKLERGGGLSKTEEQRYWENYDRYTELGGNSYIHASTERLKNEGKL